MFTSEDVSEAAGKKYADKIFGQAPFPIMIWTPNYHFTDGILESKRAHEKAKNATVLINRYILNSESIRLLKSGEVTVVAGGHYTQGAWVMVMLYDYLRGEDFINEGLQMTTPMDIVTTENITLYENLVSDKNLSLQSIDAIDFRKYSKIHNPKISKYNFVNMTLLKLLEEHN